MREFFKPSTVKIILTLFIPFYFGIVGVASSGALNGEINISSKLSVVFLPFIVVIVGGIWFIVKNEQFFDVLSSASVGELILYFITEVILPLAVSYALACGVVYLYNIFAQKRLVKKEKKSLSLETPIKK